MVRVLPLVRAVVDDLDVVVLGSVGLEDSKGAVGRAIIGDAYEDLDALLAQDAIELLGKVFLAVVGGHENEHTCDAAHDSPFELRCPACQLAEGQGFEPWEAAQHRLTVFKTVAFNHSAIPPHVARIAVFYTRQMHVHPSGCCAFTRRASRPSP